MWFLSLILATCLVLVVSKPQSLESETERSEQQVEIQRQIVHELLPSEITPPPPSHQSPQRKIDANTKEILEKIEEINKKQGLIKKKQRPTYFPFIYSRAQQERANQFKFSRDPFHNPILDYMERDQGNGDENKAAVPPSFRRPNFNPGNFDISMTDTNPEIDPQDHIPGQYIKRKITHYQSFILPYGAPPNPNGQNPIFNNNYPGSLQSEPQNQAVEKVKDLLGNEMQQLLPFALPNNQYFQANREARQNWNWPGANLFPIYIRDPFLQMYYAVTNMIEYGPAAGSEGPCKLTPRPQGSRVKASPGNGNVGVTLEMNKQDGTGNIEITDTNMADPIRYLDMEDIDLGDDDLIKFTVNLPMTDEGRGIKDKMDWTQYVNALNDTHLTQLAQQSSFSKDKESKQTPAISSQMLQIEEIEDDAVESEKAENINVSNEGSKKVFSRDNTGNGIFIQKLKVRKGGVAIAGPGGIATAGSGGTAIVGPNGVAYTHPDGLAIAGSGTKVVAVDPKIDLNEVIKNTVLNGTRHVPNTRVGKVVAIGPVVYYNRGEVNVEGKLDSTRVILIPFYGGGKGQSLQITETSQGTVLSSVIIKTPTQPPPPPEQTEIEIDPYELENPPLPTKHDLEHSEGYNDYIKNIQSKAIEIVKLQELAKRNGELTKQEEDAYQKHMLSINESAKRLAEIQEGSNASFENREGLNQWFDSKKQKEVAKNNNKKREEDKKRKKEEERKKQEEEKRKKEEENKKKQNEKEEEEKEEESEQENDGVAINLPPDDASVAEAKPVGLAVAGEGGVAASKPIATAVVGPGGLAIARPVGTAIAGVSPDQALVPIYAEGSGSSQHRKNPKNKPDQMSEFLNKIINKYHQT